MAFIWFSTELFVVAILLIYLIAEYAHPHDTSFGSMKLSRFLVWLGFFNSFVPLLFVMIDSNNSRIEEPLDISWAWNLIAGTQGIYVWIICPLSIVYYQGNERESVVTRLKNAFKA